jgi:hypothetical protein
MVNKLKSLFYKFNHKAQFLGFVVATLFSNILFFFTNTSVTSAADANGIQINSVSEIGSKVLCPIFNTLFWISIIVASIMIVYASFVYATAEDDAKKVSKGHNILIYAAVGVAVALIAKSAPGVVGSIFGVTGLTSC